MSDPGSQDELEKRHRNLEAVARHLVHGPAPADDPAPSAPKKSSSTGRRWAALGPIGVALAFILGKGKLLVPLLKFTKLSTLLTMFLAVWVYAQFWGWKFAVGFILLIYVHEMGHAIVLHRQGIPAGAPIFIPFVGAMISMRRLPKDAYVEALVGIGGPVLGSLGALVCLVVAEWSGSLLWYALAWIGFMINLFNLIPISPLDGGRIVGVVSRWIWVVGYAIGIAVFFATYSPILFLILLLGVFNLGKTFRSPRPGYYDVPQARRLSIGLAYFVLLGLLAVGMWYTDLQLVELRASLE